MTTRYTEARNAIDAPGAVGAPVEDVLGPLPKPWDLQHDDAGKPQVLYTADQMRSYAAQERAAERERTRQAISDRLADTVMRKYASKAECEAARAALRNAMLDVWGA